MEGTRGYKDLIVWQKAMDLVPVAYQLARKLPPEERWALADQIRRAAISIPSNIAEGQARRQKPVFIHFLSISRGSLAELDTLLLAATRLDYIEAPELEPAQVLMVEVRRLLQGLLQKLQE